jgi:hypothetical protein
MEVIRMPSLDTVPVRRPVEKVVDRYSRRASLSVIDPVQNGLKPALTGQSAYSEPVRTFRLARRSSWRIVASVKGTDPTEADVPQRRVMTTAVVDVTTVHGFPRPSDRSGASWRGFGVATARRCSTTIHQIIDRAAEFRDLPRRGGLTPFREVWLL